MPLDRFTQAFLDFMKWMVAVQCNLLSSGNGSNKRNLRSGVWATVIALRWNTNDNWDIESIPAQIFFSESERVEVLFWLQGQIFLRCHCSQMARNVTFAHCLNMLNL